MNPELSGDAFSTHIGRVSINSQAAITAACVAFADAATLLVFRLQHFDAQMFSPEN